MKLENLRTLQPHLRHVDLNVKVAKNLYQIGDGVLRRARHTETLIDSYPEGVFELAEKLDDVLYIILTL